MRIVKQNIILFLLIGILFSACRLNSAIESSMPDIEESSQEQISEYSESSEEFEESVNDSSKAEKPSQNSQADEGEPEPVIPLFEEPVFQFPDENLHLEYSKLNFLEQKIYDRMLFAAQILEKTVDFSDVELHFPFGTKDMDIAISNALEALFEDQPQLFHLEQKFIFLEKNNNLLEVRLQYSYSPEKYQMMMEEISRVTDPIVSKLAGKSKYDRLKYIHDWIITSTEYDHSILNSNAPFHDSHTIYGVFAKNLAVCDGYAKAFQFLCLRLGILCSVETGRAASTHHAWNMTLIGDAFYFSDLTWNDWTSNKDNRPRFISYNYFLITANQMAIDHEVKKIYLSNEKYNSTTSNYFVCEGLVFDIYDPDKHRTQISSLLADAVREEKYTFSIKLINEKYFSILKKDILFIQDLVNSQFENHRYVKIYYLQEIGSTGEILFILENRQGAVF